MRHRLLFGALSSTTTGAPTGGDTTKLEPVGGVIEGSYSGFVTRSGNAAHNLEGTFRVCHTADLFAP